MANKCAGYINLRQTRAVQQIQFTKREAVNSMTRPSLEDSFTGNVVCASEAYRLVCLRSSLLHYGSNLKEKRLTFIHRKCGVYIHLGPI